MWLAVATYNPPAPSPPTPSKRNILSVANIIQNCPVMFPDGLSCLILKHSFSPPENTGTVWLLKQRLGFLSLFHHEINYYTVPVSLILSGPVLYKREFQMLRKNYCHSEPDSLFSPSVYHFEDWNNKMFRLSQKTK